MYEVEVWTIFEFSFMIWSLSECDSDTHRIAIFFESIQRIMVFHLSWVAMLFVPLTFRAVIIIDPASGGVE